MTLNFQHDKLLYLNLPTTTMMMMTTTAAAATIIIIIIIIIIMSSNFLFHCHILGPKFFYTLFKVASCGI